MKSSPINLIIFPIPVDKGMAGTTRLRNFIKFLPRENMRITNVIMSDREESYDYYGVDIRHLNTESLGIFGQYRRVKQELKSLYREGERNVLFHYDVPFQPTMFYMLHQARKEWGFTTLVDIVEDYNTKILNLGFRGNARLKLSGLVQKKLTWIADGAIGISGYLIKFLEKYFPNRPIVHLPVAFDPSSIIKGSDDTGKQAIIVFYGGSFGEKDGMEFLIDGFEFASSEFDKLELHMTGKGSRIDTKKFAKILAESGAKQKIRNHGFVSYDSYCSILSSADILCMTRRNSKYANAGFPYKLGEFLATGKPVIVSRLKEIEHYLPDDACCYVTPESSEEIADALRFLMDPEKRRKIGEKGKDVAYKHFNAVTVAGELYSFIDKLSSQS